MSKRLPQVFLERSDSPERYSGFGSHAQYLLLAVFDATLAIIELPLGLHEKRIPLNTNSVKYHKRYVIVTGMLPRIIALITVASLCALMLLLMLTSPATAGPFGLLALFIAAYLTFMGLISFFLFVINRLIVQVFAGAAVRRPMQPMSFKRAYYFSTVLAAAPVMLIGLQSVHAVGLYEIILVIIFEVVACTYVSKRTM